MRSSPRSFARCAEVGCDTRSCARGAAPSCRTPSRPAALLARFAEVQLALDTAEWYAAHEMVLGSASAWRHARSRDIAPRVEVVIREPGGAEFAASDGSRARVAWSPSALADPLPAMRTRRWAVDHSPTAHARTRIAVVNEASLVDALESRRASCERPDPARPAASDQYNTLRSGPSALDTPWSGHSAQLTASPDFSEPMSASSPSLAAGVRRMLAAMERWGASDLFLCEGVRRPRRGCNGAVVPDRPARDVARRDRRVSRRGRCRRSPEDELRAHRRSGPRILARPDAPVSHQLWRARRDVLSVVARALPSGELRLDELGLPPVVAELGGGSARSGRSSAAPTDPGSRPPSPRSSITSTPRAACTS